MGNRKAWLHYTGKGIISVLICKLVNEKRQYIQKPLKSNSMYNFNFDKGDVLDEPMIQYYRQLKELNIQLYIIDEPNEDSSNEETKVETPDTTVDQAQTILPQEDQMEGVPDTGIQEEGSDLPPVAEAKDYDDTVEDVSTSTSEDPSNQDVSDADSAELLAYLEATYDRDGLKALATELGVEYSSRISTENLLTKIIDQKPEEIAAMIKG